MEIKEYVPLKNHTSYKIGGPARYFCEPSSAADIKSALGFAKEHCLKIYVLGKGTNVLVSDKGVEGLVIKIGPGMGYFSMENDKARVGSGLLLDQLIKHLLEEGRGGFEQLAGIPGCIGGALYMNAGAHGIALGDFVQESTVMDHQGILRCLTPKEHQFSYRTSIFQQKNLIVLETLFNTLPRHPDEALQTIATSKEKRKQLPLLPSCGSTFRNPEGRYAGKIIDELGLKGAQIGQAQISPIHANFIVNLGGASAQEVYSLIRLVQQKAANHEITLETEVRLWGQFD